MRCQKGWAELWFKRHAGLGEDLTLACKGTGLNGFPDNMVKNFGNQPKKQVTLCQKKLLRHSSSSSCHSECHGMKAKEAESLVY